MIFLCIYSTIIIQTVHNNTTTTLLHHIYIIYPAIGIVYIPIMSGRLHRPHRRHLCRLIDARTSIILRKNYLSLIGRCSTARSASGDICAAAATIDIAASRLGGSGVAGAVLQRNKVSMGIFR